MTELGEHFAHSGAKRLKTPILPFSGPYGQRARQGEIIPSVWHSVRRICTTVLPDVAPPQM